MWASMKFLPTAYLLLGFNIIIEKGFNIFQI